MCFASGKPSKQVPQWLSGYLSVGHSMWTTLSQHILASGSQLVHSTQGPGASLRQLLITATHTIDSSSSCSAISPKYFGRSCKSESCEGLPSLYSSLPGSRCGYCLCCQGFMGCDFEKYFLLDLFSIPSITSVRED